MALLKKRFAGGFMDEIRCDEPSYLIWKWHPYGAKPGKNTRENAVRWGSSLRVKDGEVAVFVYKKEDGTVQEFIEGPFDQKIETKNLPAIASLVGFAYEGGTPFQAEIYFINTAQIIQTMFGVPFFDVYDPRFTDFGVPVAVRGTISFKIADYKKFIKLHRLTNFSLDDFRTQIRDAIARYVKDIVANAPAANDIPVIQLETKTAVITDAVEYDIKQRLEESFGVEVSGVDIGAIEIDKTSEGYRHLMNITRDVTTVKVEAETRDYTERLRIQREEGQYAMHKQTQSANIGAFQVEKQAEVGLAGAEALGHMGANGAGSVSLGGDGGGAGNGAENGTGAGFNPAAMMAGMALGGAVGQNIAATMNGVMNGSIQNNAASAQGTANGTTPPPVKSNLFEEYYVAVNGQSTGPYSTDTLKQMAASGQFSAEMLVWKQGMTDWIKAGSMQDLKELFVSPPPIPTDDLG